MKIQGCKLIQSMRYVQENISSGDVCHKMKMLKKIHKKKIWQTLAFTFMKFEHFHHDEKKKIFSVEDNICFLFYGFIEIGICILTPGILLPVLLLNPFIIWTTSSSFTFITNL